MRYHLKQELSVSDEFGFQQKQCDIQVYIRECGMSNQGLMELCHSVNKSFTDIFSKEFQGAEKKSLQGTEGGDLYE